MDKNYPISSRDETLSDNRNQDLCRQCKDCRWWGNSDAFSSRYFKLNCDKYPMPGNKPRFVIDNQDDCVFYERRGK